MKKVIRLSENQLINMIKTIIKEQDGFDEFEYISKYMKMADTNIRRQPWFGQLVHTMFGGTFQVENVRGEKEHNLLKIMLKDFLEAPIGEKFILIVNCGRMDFSDIDFCQYPDVVIVNLIGTSNNFVKTQNDCWALLDERGIYTFG